MYKYIYINIYPTPQEMKKISPRGGLVYPITKLAFGDCPGIQWTSTANRHPQSDPTLISRHGQTDFGLLSLADFKATCGMNSLFN